MRFNLFRGERKFLVLKDSAIQVFLSTQHAQKKIEKHGGSIFVPDSGGPRTYQGTYADGALIVASGTIVELLAYTMPFYSTAKSVKMKLTYPPGSKLGTFYLYTNIQSLENIELEPCK